MTETLIYLAGPYSAAPEEFYRLHMKYTAALINDGFLVFSPILHCHALAKHHDLPGDYEFWKRYNHHMMGLCSALLVMRVQGWEDSEGVKGEIAYAVENLIPINLVKLNEGKLTIEALTV